VTNIDRLEETLIGADTSYRVNGIAFQSKVAGSVSDVLSEITKSKKGITPTALRQLRAMVDQPYTDFNHPNLLMPRIRSDEADAKSFVQLMEYQLVEPLQSRAKRTCKFVYCDCSTIRSCQQSLTQNSRGCISTFPGRAPGNCYANYTRRN
jgi:hypothetical protein